ncbi:MAG TPA: patatin-like phospholipase family protein [Gemmatimonadales bacterium]|jgi:predicted acylesterase/phospholipase RssA
MSRASLDARSRLREARDAFKSRHGDLHIPELWYAFQGKIAAVLAGGGARGGYEAGALLAMQDAGLPTHLITATSIGSINGASYAAHATGLVGNAEPLVDAWFELTPTAVGVEWTRYTWMLFGLVATFSGITNLTYYILQTKGLEIHLAHPALAWGSLCLAGITVLLFHDQLPYLWFLLRRLLRGSRWRPARRRLAVSAVANLVVASFIVSIFESLDIPGALRDLLSRKPLLVFLGLVVLVIIQQVRRRANPRVGRIWGRILRLPFRTGIFSNFERSRFLRRYIPADRLRTTPIRVVLTSTDLESGVLRFFTNADPASFLNERGVERAFAKRELIRMDDLMDAVIASSALPIAYEPLDLDGRLHADGAIVGSQPIRPAIRLGSDVLFLISMEPPGGPRGAMHTFVDVGLRALDILMQRNLQADIGLLEQANSQIETAAAQMGMRPEDVVIEFEGRMFRYVKAFSIRPDQPIENSILDFGGRATGETILLGYKDAVAQIEAFANYVNGGGGFQDKRRTLPLELVRPRRKSN